MWQRKSFGLAGTRTEKAIRGWLKRGALGGDLWRRKPRSLQSLPGEPRAWRHTYSWARKKKCDSSFHNDGGGGGRGGWRRWWWMAVVVVGTNTMQPVLPTRPLGCRRFALSATVALSAAHRRAVARMRHPCGLHRRKIAATWRLRTALATKRTPLTNHAGPSIPRRLLSSPHHESPAAALPWAVTTFSAQNALRRAQEGCRRLPRRPSLTVQRA